MLYVIAEGLIVLLWAVDWSVEANNFGLPTGDGRNLSLAVLLKLALLF